MEIVRPSLKSQVEKLTLARKVKYHFGANADMSDNYEVKVALDLILSFQFLTGIHSYMVSQTFQAKEMQEREENKR